MQTVYCVEDDDSIRELIVYAVKSGGFDAEGFANARDFEKALEKKLPNIVLLDIMLPDKDGIEILKDLRKNSITKLLPVIMLTAKGSESDKLKGFDCGADDYITKPFSVLEMISRVKAVLKRSEGNKQEDIISYNGIFIDNISRVVTVDGESVSLTFKEFELLSCLMKNKGAVMSREVLLNKIWGYHFEGETRTLDVHIGSLRHKLKDKGSCIETIRNVGYKIK